MKARSRRRIAKRHKAVFITYGVLLPRDQNYATAVHCFVCGKQHRASGVACVTDRRGSAVFMLCNSCLAADAQTNAVAERFLALPDIEISEGGAR